MGDPFHTETVFPEPPPEGQVRLLAPGTEIGSRYEIRSVLGVGGYAVVYRAFDRELRREVALKILRPDRLSQASLRRFRREAGVARDVAHPRLVRIFDIGAEDRVVYLTMEVIEGISLKERLRTPPLPVEEAIRIALQVLEGLEALHRMGIVHRDLKPGNILLTQEEEVKLADFGLARHLDRDETRATAAEALVGTVEYLSPEQALGEEAAPQSDLYAVGVVLFEMLTGRLPWEAQTSFGTLVARLKEKAPEVRSLRPEVPRWLSALVGRLLEKDGGRRYPSAEAVLADLRRRKVRRRWPLTVRTAAWAAAAVVLLALALGSVSFPTWERPRFSHLVALGDAEIAAIGEGGDVLWSLSGVDREIAFRHTLARIRPGGPKLLAAVILPPRTYTVEAAHRLSFRDPATGAVVKEVTLPSAAPAFPGVSHRYFVYTLAAMDLDGDGVDEVLISYVHPFDIPSYTVLYEPRFERSRVIFRAASGHHRFNGTLDLDGDGREELLFAGINNLLGWYYVAAAVRVEPWVGEGFDSVIHSTASPEIAFVPELRQGLLWYTLLPRGRLREDLLAFRVDPERKTLSVPYADGREAALNYHGFLLDQDSSLSPQERNGLRSEAHGHLREARRLRGAGFPIQALAEIDQGIQKAEDANLPLLAECLRRFRGRLLVAAGRPQEAEGEFLALADTSEAGSDIAFDAAEAFHLAGDLRRAVTWYERGTGRGGASEAGKDKYEILEGAVLALAELGAWEEAYAIVDRYRAAYPEDWPTPQYYEQYIRWRSGARVGVEELRRQRIPVNADLLRYWPLEFERVVGTDPETLLPQVEEELGNASETHPLVLALKAELLAALGRQDEAREAVEDAYARTRTGAGTNTTLRAHFDLVSERRSRIAGGAPARAGGMAGTTGGD